MSNPEPISEFLDGEHRDAPDATDLDKREIAEHLVAAGVARHLLSSQAQETASLVRENMDLIARQDAAARRRVAWRWTAGIAAAASIVASVLILGQEEKPTLEPLVRRIERFAVDEIDREYQVEITSKDMMSAMLSKSVSTRLFARGRDRFAARIDVNFFGSATSTTWMGFDGEESWLVPGEMPMMPGQPALPVIVSRDGLLSPDDAGELGPFQAVTEQMGLFMNLLADLGTDYEVQPTSTDADREDLSKGEKDLTAYRRPQADYRMPDRIRVVVDEKTGVVRVLRMRFRPPTGRGMPSKPAQLRLALVQETVVADDFYGHREHHDPNRQVILR